MTVQVRAYNPVPPEVDPPHDSTLRTAAAKAVEFHRRIVEGMTCGVLTIDREGLVTTVNDHARTTLDLGEVEILGRPCQDVLTHCPRLARVLLDSFRMTTPPTRDEMRIRTREDRPRTIGFTISMIGATNGSAPDGAAIFFKDLTKVEEQEERERLRDRLAVLGEMAAQMAHEIRNPLTSIEVSATLQKRRLLGRGDPTDLVDRISIEIRRIETTVANCLNYARPLSLDRSPADPVHLVEEAIALARQRDGRPGVLIERNVPQDFAPLLCDGPLLKEVLVNILVNASEAMDGEGKILVALSEEEGFLTVRVQDTGPGIPPEILSRIFYPFFTTKTSGSGIGLATARKVVEAHGGWLEAVSEPGQGASFILRIPLEQSGDAGRAGDTA